MIETSSGRQQITFAVGVVVAASGILFGGVKLYYDIEDGTLPTRQVIIVGIIFTLLVILVGGIIFWRLESSKATIRRLKGEILRSKQQLDQERREFNASLDRERRKSSNIREQNGALRDLNAKVHRLKEMLERKGFFPDLIAGIARTGMITAAQLSEEFKKKPRIPITSLWPRPDYNNCLNNINFLGEKSPLGMKDVFNILIVDDIARSGKSLSDAKLYLEDKLDRTRFRIETAAISCYDYQFDDPERDPVLPTFYVDRPIEAIGDSLGQIEER